MEIFIPFFPCSFALHQIFFLFAFISARFPASNFMCRIWGKKKVKFPWLIWLRIQQFHCCVSDHCCGASSISGLGTSTFHRCSQKEKEIQRIILQEKLLGPVESLAKFLFEIFKEYIIPMLYKLVQNNGGKKIGCSLFCSLLLNLKKI